MKRVPRRHRISIQRSTDTKDSFGEARPNYRNLVTRYPASVRDESQREFNSTLHVQSEKRIFIEIRDPHVRDDDPQQPQEIVTSDRVVWHKPTGDKVLDIISVLAGENLHGDITIVCLEQSDTQQSERQED